MWILEALHERGLRGIIVGVIYDPALAAEAARLGEGAQFRAVFNRAAPGRILEALRGRRPRRQHPRRRLRRAARLLCRAADEPRAVGAAGSGRHLGRRHLDPHAMRGPGVPRDDGARHRRRPRGRREVARALPRGVRRVLRA